MKKLTSIVVALIAATGILFTGCAFDAADPDREVKIEQTKAAVTTLAGSAITRVIRKNPDTLPIFEKVGEVFTVVRDTEQFDPAVVAQAIGTALSNSGALGNLDEDDRQTVIDVKNFLVTIYSINYADRLKADVSEREFLLNLADVFATAITQAVADAKL